MSARDSRPSLGRGIAAALVLALAGAAVLAALAPLVGSSTALRAVVALLGFGYLLYLLGSSGERVGRITVVLLWTVVAAVAWAAALPIVPYVLLHVGLVWLVRSLYFHSGLLAALADLGLTLLGVAFASWAASRSGSAALALWCFFLVQAFHVSIPAALATDRERGGRDAHDPFRRAQQAAESAIRRMSAPR
jgi:hypothetical protein